MFEGRVGIYFYFNTSTQIFWVSKNLADIKDSQELGHADGNGIGENVIQKKRETLQI